MKKIILGLLINILLFGSVSLSQYAVTNYYEYMVWHNPMAFPIYRMYLRLATVPLATQFYFCIRQSSFTYPGDYFYPADAYGDSTLQIENLHVQPTGDEIIIIKDFLNNSLYSHFSDTLILASLKGYNFTFPGSLHREAYTMLSNGDTVYVISGWLGKFLSFYRVVPSDKRLTIPELMSQLEELTPLAKEIKESGFRHEADSLNYLLEYVDKDKMFRVRNYLMKTTLPPNPSDSAPIYYNLIEITKFYDKGVIP